MVRERKLYLRRQMLICGRNCKKAKVVVASATLRGNLVLELMQTLL